MGACLSLLRRRPKENTDASIPVVEEAKTAVTRADEEFLHRVTREDSLKHLVRHPRIHPFSSADKLRNEKAKTSKINFNFIRHLFDFLCY